MTGEARQQQNFGSAPGEGSPYASVKAIPTTELFDVGEHECVTCKRCACTFAKAHPACPRCSQEFRAEARAQKAERALAEILDAKSYVNAGGYAVTADEAQELAIKRARAALQPPLTRDPEWQVQDGC